MGHPRHRQAPTHLPSHAAAQGVGGVVCCAGRDQDIRLLDPDNGQCINRMVGHTDRVWALARCDADTLASGGNDKCVRLWRPEEAAPLSTLKGHRGPVHALATHRGLLMSGSADQSVKLWDLAEGGCVGTLWHSSERFRDRHAVHSLAVTAGDVLASGCWGGAVRLWDLHRCRCTRTPLATPQTPPVRSRASRLLDPPRPPDALPLAWRVPV